MPVKVTRNNCPTRSCGVICWNNCRTSSGGVTDWAWTRAGPPTEVSANATSKNASRTRFSSMAPPRAAPRSAHEPRAGRCHLKGSLSSPRGLQSQLRVIGKNAVHAPIFEAEHIFDSIRRPNVDAAFEPMHALDLPQVNIREERMQGEVVAEIESEGTRPGTHPAASSPRGISGRRRAAFFRLDAKNDEKRTLFSSACFATNW